MALADTYRRRLREVALDQYGYVTTRDAEGIGVPAVELRKLAQRGGLDHITYGLYRFDDIPHTARDQHMEAVLRVGPGAYLTHDAVLALHDLGLVNPRRIRVGTPRRARPHLPDDVEVVQRRLDKEDLTTFEGIPTTTVRRALLDCRDLVMRERLLDAAREAARRGLLRRDQADGVIAEIGDAA
jgi:predicted transcriptional regulator of viral defense system